MAVCCAASHPEHCQAFITESAQAFVEAATLDGIRQAERQFAEPGQFERLHKYHADKARWVLRAWVNMTSANGVWMLNCVGLVVRCWLCTVIAMSMAQRISLNVSLQLRVAR
jgi:hypothetical protein